MHINQDNTLLDQTPYNEGFSYVAKLLSERSSLITFRQLVMTQNSGLNISSSILYDYV